MAVLVDYVCRSCRGRTEAWVSSPPPAIGTCPACGAESRRAWAAVGTLKARSPERSAPRSTRRAAEALCVRNPDVPGLCHMSEAAGRAWVARARRDNRALDRELQRQERSAAEKPPTMGDVIAHDHGHGHEGNSTASGA